MLKFAAALFLAILATSTCKEFSCLEGDTHKEKPSPEPDMHECTLYSKSSCCDADFTAQLDHSPVIKVNNSYWNRCGNLSKSCEDYTKKIECFYRCSPYAAHWINPNYTAAIEFVPLCQNFCDDWYEACKEDLTCVRNWLTDWEWDDNGVNHCKSDCSPYSEVFANGTELCQTLWGHSFKVSESSCLCLQMNEKDDVAIKYILSESSEESSSVSSSEERACRKKVLRSEHLNGQEWPETIIIEMP
ncbi:riboflavin-binding protein [Alligator mississippiensis]|nr:riboflavin-binding protein [Alligator mississippiensis]XP_059583752.1 riboflavin-binding protein [Alligator mississippiensis]